VEDEAEQPESAPTFDDELLTFEDVARWLRLNKMTVRNMISRGELSAIYLGQRRVRIRRSELVVHPVSSFTHASRTLPVYVHLKGLAVWL
jgi:excisionase family DNA binding protein